MSKRHFTPDEIKARGLPHKCAGGAIRWLNGPIKLKTFRLKPMPGPPRIAISDRYIVDLYTVIFWLEGMPEDEAWQAEIRIGEDLFETCGEAVLVKKKITVEWIEA